MPQPVPAFYDNLDLTRREAFTLWSRGVKDRRSAFHTPVAATIGQDGRPRARIVVLRAFDPAAHTARFHTDRRSSKVAELEADARISLLAYDYGAKIQVRLEGTATLHRDDSVTDAAWAATRAQSRVCYGVAPGPGGVIPDGGAFALPDEADAAALEQGRAHFAAVVMTFDRMEWLYLAHAGHRRACFEWTDGHDEGQWLAP